MRYKIEQAHVIFKDGKTDKVMVLWESSPGYVRATYIDTTPRGGYEFVNPNTALSPDLFQRVAAYGMRCPDEFRKVFLNHKKLKFED